MSYILGFHCHPIKNDSKTIRCIKSRNCGVRQRCQVVRAPDLKSVGRYLSKYLAQIHKVKAQANASIVRRDTFIEKLLCFASRKARLYF